MVHSTNISTHFGSNILKTADTIKQNETVKDFFRGNSPHSVHEAINVHFSAYEWLWGISSPQTEVKQLPFSRM